jgi:hypothetical protein
MVAVLRVKKLCNLVGIFSPKFWKNLLAPSSGQKSTFQMVYHIANNSINELITSYKELQSSTAVHIRSNTYCANIV